MKVTNDGSSGFRVSVSTSGGGSWEQFPSDASRYHKRFISKNAVQHSTGLRGDFVYRGGFETRGRVDRSDGTNISYSTVYFDYFARGGTGGKYFEMKIRPDYYGLIPVRAKHYYTRDHWVNITLYVTDRDSDGKRLLNGGYNMHCWISNNDGNSYYVSVYLDNDGDSTFEQTF